MRQFLIILCLFFSLSACSKDSFRVMFYNVENLFDCEHDFGKNDTEFTPDGAKKWTPARYKHKLNNIAKVITAVSEWEDLALIGLCEVENEIVVNDLVNESVLRTMKYNYVMTDSPDRRGIDVALLYQRDMFNVISTNSIRIHFRNKHQKTRDILHVTGKVQSGDTLDVFVCHYPSRSGGEKASEGSRNFVATILKKHTDSITYVRTKPNLLIMGDFNDYPDNASMFHILKAQPETEAVTPNGLYNLFYKHMQEGKGSYKYQGKWNVLDQIIVSGNLMNPKNKLHVKPHSATIFYDDFILSNDGGKNKKKPFRSFLGNNYIGGYSDHLPVYIDIRYK